MGVSSSITARSSRLGSRAQSVEMDSRQEVSGPWSVAPQPMCTVIKAAERSITVFRTSKLIFFFVSAISVSSFPHGTVLTTLQAELSVL